MATNTKPWIKSKRLLLLLFVFAAVALAYFFRQDAMKQAVSIGLVDDEAPRSHHPKAFSTGIDTLQYDESGEIAYRLIASRIDYIDNFNPPFSESLRLDSAIAPFLPSLLASQDIARLENPAVEMRAQDGTYQIVSDRGYIVNDEQKIEFIGDVILTRAESKDAHEPFASDGFKAKSSQILNSAKTSKTTFDQPSVGPLSDSNQVTALTRYMRLDIDRRVAETDAVIRIDSEGVNLTANAFRADMERGTLRFYDGVQGKLLPKN